MKVNAGKLAAFSGFAVAICIVVIVSIILCHRVVENWYLRKLRIGTIEEQCHAAERIGRIKSVDAIPLLLRKMKELCSDLWAPNNRLLRKAICDALVNIGEPAMPSLIDALTEDEPDFPFVAAYPLIGIYERIAGEHYIKLSRLAEIRDLIPLLEAIESQTKNTKVRNAAAKALVRMR